MRPSRSRGLFSRALIVVVLVATAFVGVPTGPPVSNGQWPGLAGVWDWFAGLFPEPSVAVAEPAPRGGQGKKPPKRVREVQERGTASARVFAMSDGTFEAEVSPDPTHYRDGEGAWREAETSVKELPKDGYRFGVERNTFASRFGESTDRLVRFEFGGKQAALGIDVPGRKVAPRVEGSTVTYPGVFEGADLQYVVTPESLKENIVLARPVSDPTFRFTLRVVGVTARAQSDGSVGFFRSEAPDGPPVFEMPKPFMVDSKDDAKAPYGKAYSDKVTQTVDQRGANITVTVTADKGWLNAPERQYPVTIDPTIQIEPTPTEGRDAQIWSDTRPATTAPTTGCRWARTRGARRVPCCGSILQWFLKERLSRARRCGCTTTASCGRPRTT